VTLEAPDTNCRSPLLNEPSGGGDIVAALPYWRCPSSRDRVSVFLRDWVVEQPRFEWAGMRPTTPDDLPLISAVPGFGHLYVATGHGMLGVTLSPATAVALAPLVLEDRQVPELEPFRLDRFAGARANGSGRQAPATT
jgi:FAD dependent oxidoreductase